MEPKTTIDKLRFLLPHWIEHNRDHEAEFRKWAKSARLENAGTLAEILVNAAESMEATGKFLEKAQAEAGGQNQHHDHPHPHPHHHP